MLRIANYKKPKSLQSKLLKNLKCWRKLNLKKLQVMISVRSGKVRSIDDEFLNRSFSQQKISTEKQNSVKSLPLLKSSFKTYCGQTSLHGYSYLFRDESARFHILHQIIWTIVIIVSQHFPHLNLPFYNKTDI